MFYADFLFVKRGPLAKVWQLSHLSKKLTRRDLASTDIAQSVQFIEQPDAPLALRAQGQLLLGLVRIYDGQVRFLQQDCTEAQTKLDSMADRGGGGRGGRGVEVGAEQLMAHSAAITVSERAMYDAMDPFDALEEQRYLEQHNLSFSQPLDASRLSHSLNLSQSQSSRFSQQARPEDISMPLELPRDRPSMASQFELEELQGPGMGMSLEDAMDDGMGLGVGGVGFGDISLGGGMELEGAGMDMGLDDMKDISGMIDEQKEALSADGEIRDADLLSQRRVVLTEEDQRLMREREERRKERKRLRFAVEQRDEDTELDDATMRAAIRDTHDIVEARAGKSLVDEKRRRERLLAEGRFMHSSMSGPMRERSLDALMAELFSVEGMKLPASESAAAERAAPEDEYVDVQQLAGDDFSLDMSNAGADMQPPATPIRQADEPAAADVPPTPASLSAAELRAAEQEEHEAADRAHDFFGEDEEYTEERAEQEVAAHGYSDRGRKVLSLLADRYRQPRVERVAFDELVPGGGRAQQLLAARMFYQLLVLSQHEAVQCEQADMYGEIQVAKGGRFDEMSRRMGMPAGGRRAASARA